MTCTPMVGCVENTPSAIQVYTGRFFDVLNPRPEDIDIRDIAHALSLQCRYGGHVERFYSVAQHSVLVSSLVPAEDALWGLLHDASEAYLVDLPRPVKHNTGIGTVYREIEEKIMPAMAERFGLPWPEPPSIFIADNRLLFTEKRDLLKPGLEWGMAMEPYPFRIEPWPPEVAESRFKKRFRELCRG